MEELKRVLLFHFKHFNDFNAYNNNKKKELSVQVAFNFDGFDDFVANYRLILL